MSSRFWAAPAIASDELATNAAAIGDTRIVQAELILRRATDFWRASPDITMIRGHLALRQMVRDIPGLRSLIAVERDGQLAFDSYNPTLFAVDLSDRGYFKRALEKPDERVTLSPVLVGRNSGQPFLPIAKAVGNGRVIMASFVQGFFFSDLDLCALCGLVAIMDGEIIDSQPEIRGPQNLTEIIESLPSSSGSIKAGNLSVKIWWRKSAIIDGLSYVYYDASPPQ